MDADDTVVHIERVCCLECGTNYVKPTDGGTARRNPGCPACGYLGWISALVPKAPGSGATAALTPPSAPQPRYGEDPPRTLVAKPR
jgi:hypothetical protein